MAVKKGGLGKGLDALIAPPKADSAPKQIQKPKKLLKKSLKFL